MRLKDRIILVSGANGALGNAVTQAFLDEGATVIGVSRSIQSTDFPHDHFHPVSAELGNSAAVKSLVETVVQKWGRVDAVVHLVGAFAGGTTIEETPESTLNQMFETNFRSAFFLLQGFVPVMKKFGGGAILAVGSRTVPEPVPQLGAYSAAKAALLSLISTVAAEGRNHGITANAILPATLDTPGNRSANPEADFTRWVLPSQIASLMVHLASREGSQISGAAIPVYGGER